MTTENIFLLLRGGERILIVVFAGLAIYYGYRLFALTLPADGELAAKGAKLSFRMSRVGPGVFFALFGVSVMIVELRSAGSLSRKPDVGGQGSIDIGFSTGGLPGGGDKLRAVRHLEAVNYLLRSFAPQGPPDAQRSRALMHADDLKVHLLTIVEGIENVDRFTELRSAAATEKEEAWSSKDRATYKRVNQLWNAGE